MLSKDERERMRQRLRAFGQLSEEEIEERLRRLEERAQVKRHLIQERGFSNEVAEAYLDRARYLRPPGWHPVVFYPGSYRPRSVVLLCLILIALGLGLLLA
jgi:hypothetical protein